MSFWTWKAPLYSRVRHLPVLANLLQAEKKSLAALLRAIPPLPGRHLDIGSGTGDGLTLFDHTKKLVCVDASLAMLHQLVHSPKLLARAEFLPFPDAAFDCVSALGVLEYVKEAQACLQEIRRVLTPQGVFLFTSSPPTLANYARGISGERLYLRSTAQIAELLRETGWRQRAHAQTWLQEQWLAEPS